MPALLAVVGVTPDAREASRMRERAREVGEVAVGRRDAIFNKATGQVEVQPGVLREARAEMPLRSAGNRIYARCSAVRWGSRKRARGRRGQRDRHNCEVMPAKVRCAIASRRGFNVKFDGRDACVMC